MRQATTFGELLRRHRVAAGLTQEELAERAGLSVRGLSYLEKDGRQPYRDTVRRLADALCLEHADRLTLEDAVRTALAAPQEGAQPSWHEQGAANRSHNLPLALTSFVGREREMAEVADLLGRARLLTLTGPGGVGKTRLALQVVAAAVGQYAHGAWLVELAAWSDPNLVPQAVATALQVREDLGRPALASLTEALRLRHLLLILDNCEHLIAACAELAEALLRACPHLQILATSRESLGCDGEVAWGVPPLRRPDPRLTDPVEVATCDAARLFVERARAAQPSFEVTTSNVAAVVQVCRRLDGIPLALEMAAARLRGLSVQELATRLDERFRLLTAGRRTALSRQRTLQATVEWSYGLLDESERVLFDRLSVFGGGFSLPAAEAVCAGGAVAERDVLDVLLRLVDKSLVTAEEGAFGATRYRLLETLRQYGRERVAGRAEATEVRERHADYFLTLAETTMDRLWGPDHLAAVKHLDVARDDLWAAFAWFLESGAPAKSVRLGHALEGVWSLRGIAEVRHQVEQLLAAPGLRTPSAERALGLQRAGQWLCQIGDKVGLTLLEEALALARRFGDERVIGETLTMLGLYKFDPWGDPAGALPLLEEALALFQALDDPWGQSNCLLFLGQAVGVLGDHGRAATLARQALDLSRASGALERLSYAHEVLGEVAYALGDDAEAERLWGECLVTYRELGEGVGIATVEGDLGRLALRQGRHVQARQHFMAALTALREREAGELVWGLSELAGLARVAAAQGQFERALQLAGATTAAYAVRGFVILPADREALDRAATEAQAGLGEPAAMVAWTEGHAMTLEQAVSCALADHAP